MKKILLFIVVMFASTCAAFSQNSLPESPRSSAEIFVYKLNEKEVRNLYLREKDLDESMLHTFVLSCAERKDIPLLPKGNYISVRVVENELEYSDHTVDNFYHALIEDERVMLFITDTLGNVIDDAVVRRGIKRLKFDKSTQTYNISRVGDEKVVEINNDGVLHYIEFDEEYNYRYRNNFFRNSWWRVKRTFYNIFVPDNAPVRQKYDGFVVFSKPKYKPGETVRFKAYINIDGRPYNREAEVALTSRYQTKIDTVLTTLSPYRPGMYEWEFPLSESLKLKLDNNYNIVLRTKGKRTNDIDGSFRFEEYELDRIAFEATAGKKRYVKGEEVKLQFKARDENNMPVYDGRVEVVVQPATYDKRKYFSESVFIPDESWRHSLEMTGKSSEEIILPDSIFVNNAAMKYNIECSFFDSGNEKQSEKLSVFMDARDRLIDFSVEKGVLTVREMAGGESVTSAALLTAHNYETGIVWQESVTLPYSMPLIWIATDYKAETETSCGDFCVDDIEGEIIGYRFFRENGNVRLIVDNPAGFPFWYTIRKGDGVMDKGYATELDYSKPDRGKNGYTMQLSYRFGEKARTIQESLPYVEKNISMQVNTPMIVYPGQTASVDVTVSNKNGRPVRNADITAWAFTSKFGPYSPDVSVFGRSRSGKRFDNKRYDTYEDGPWDAKSPMKWNIWRERMGLDSIEYYRFLYPDIYYSYSEKAEGGVTQIAPYIVIDGNVQGVHILYIDEQPHYFHNAGQLDVYSFPVTPGHHTLKFRTYDRQIMAYDVFVEEGTKTIISINGKRSAVYQATDGINALPVRIYTAKYGIKNKGVLTEGEIAGLKNHLITVDNVFGSAILANGFQSIDLPATINAGGVYYYLNNKEIKSKYNYRPDLHRTEPILAGPFPYRGFSTGGRNIGTLYIDTAYICSFDIEGGYRYNIRKNYVKQQSWKTLPFPKHIRPFTTNPSLTANALTPEAIREMFNDRLLEKAEQNSGLMFSLSSATDKGCRLKLEIGHLAGGEKPANPLLIRIGQEKEDASEYFYYGSTRDFDKFPEGSYRIDLIFRDSTMHSCFAELKPGGLNYLKIDPVVPGPACDASRVAFNVLYSGIHVAYPTNPFLDYNRPETLESRKAMPGQNTGVFDAANYTGKVITGTVRDQSGEPIFGAAVMIEGTTTATLTDIDGKFTLPDTGTGNLQISFLGFRPLRTRLISGYDYKITLESDTTEIGAVFVTGSGYIEKRSFTGNAYYVSSALEGRAAGVSVQSASPIRVRGVSTIPDGGGPLIIVNGIPYDGTMSDLDPATILSVNIAKKANTAIYGARAANGVIFVETCDTAQEAAVEERIEFPEGWSDANMLRTNFHDDAFWRPALSTGRDGTVSFEVTYPDDITNWTANFIAVGGRKQTDKAQINIRSFKPINAQLSLPQFAVHGDSLNVIGRLTNHSRDTIEVKRSIVTDGYGTEERISLKSSHVDTIPVTVKEPDSLHITYSLTTDSGYFDGERRLIPVYRQGVLESHGEFAVLDDAKNRRFETDPALGTVTVHAETSAMKILLDEIDKVDRYPYLCNEQMASKIKALLSKKQICSLLGVEFKDNAKIKRLIRKLERNQNDDNLWGWWNRDKTELWISKQIVEAMLNAQAGGYEVNFNKQAASNALIRELNLRLSYIGDAANIRASAKNDLLDLLGLLKKLDAKIDYSQYLTLVSSLPDVTLNSRLKSMEMMLLLDTGTQLQADTLLNLASETIMGSMYWSEKEKSKAEPRRIILPYTDNVDNTLIAYRILRAAGEHDAELRKIRSYFFEMRKSGSWRNIYESSRILETILPDMIGPDDTFENASLTINGKRSGPLPITEEFPAGETVEVKNNGTMPVFFTVYQQAWNEMPEAASEGFSIRTALYEKGKEVTELKAGTGVDLTASVSVASDTEYVMIEIPIPAGCSYESKGRGIPWLETHREYYKEKVVIFCKKLPKGKHNFTIKLLPRYSGLYHINPARVELMYYPTFFGRENMKVYEIN